MLTRTHRLPALAAAITLGFGVTAGPTASATADAAHAPAAPTKQASPTISTLPNGDHLTITGTGRSANVTVTTPDGHTIPALRYTPNPNHTYVIPNSVLAAGKYDPAQYDIPALHTATAQPAAVPNYPLHILQITATGLDGAPTEATTFLSDIDDTSRWQGAPIRVLGGVARVAVPAGHYAAFTVFQSTDPATSTDTIRIVTQTDLTVADTGSTTLNADERTATAQAASATPKPTVSDFAFLAFNRTDLNGVTGGLIATNDGPIYLSPAPAAQVGKFSYQVLGWGGASPAGTAQPYRYDLMYPPTDHIDANQNLPVDPAKLTTVHNTIDTDAGNPRREGEYIFGPYSPELGGFQLGHVLPVPAHLTAYVNDPVGDASWIRTVIPTLPQPGSGFPAAVFLQADRTVTGGPREQWRTWAHGPLTPQVGQYRGGTYCRSCADGGTVDLGLNALVDSEPDTVGQLQGPADGHLTVYRDGVQVFSQDNTTGTELTGQPQQPGTYRMVLDLDISGFPITQSTATHTDITVPYTSTPDPKWNLPSDDFCPAQGRSTSPCSVLPVLNLGYHLATDDTNTSHAPVQVLDLQLGHQSYGQAGADAAATGATVSISFDKGATWTAATVIPTVANHFLALWPNSGAKGSTPWLKVTATDALGGAITQTVANAYTIG